MERYIDIPLYSTDEVLYKTCVDFNTYKHEIVFETVCLWFSISVNLFQMVKNVKKIFRTPLGSSERCKIYSNL